MGSSLFLEDSSARGWIDETAFGANGTRTAGTSFYNFWITVACRTERLADIYNILRMQRACVSVWPARPLLTRNTLQTRAMFHVYRYLQTCAPASKECNDYV